MDCRASGGPGRVRRLPFMGCESFHTLMKGLCLRRETRPTEGQQLGNRGYVGAHVSTMASAFSTPACIYHRSSRCRGLGPSCCAGVWAASASAQDVTPAVPNLSRKKERKKALSPPARRQQLQRMPRARLVSFRYHIIPSLKSQLWWYMPASPALGRLNTEGSLRSAWAL